MEVWKISQLFKNFLFIILNFESVFSTAHEELLNLIDCLIRGLDVSRPGEVDENYSSLQVCKIEKSFLALQALQFLRHCTTLWRVCVCMRVLNLVFYLILLFLLRVWISNSSWLIWYGEATVIYININSKMPCIPIIWNWHATPSAITHWKKKKKIIGHGVCMHQFNPHSFLIIVLVATLYESWKWVERWSWPSVWNKAFDLSLVFLHHHVNKIQMMIKYSLSTMCINNELMIAYFWRWRYLY